MKVSAFMFFQEAYMNENVNPIVRSDSFVDSIAHNWWVIALRGIAALIFGLLALFWPGITLLALTYLFGAYALVHGVMDLFLAFSGPGRHPRFWALIIEGVVSIGVGIIAFLWPGITTLSLLLLIAVWAIVSGVSEIVMAIRLRKVIHGEWSMVLAGIVSLLLGVLLLARPAVGALAVVWWIGGFAIVFGVLLLALSFRMRHEIHAPGMVARGA